MPPRLLKVVSFIAPITDGIAVIVIPKSGRKPPEERDELSPRSVRTVAIEPRPAVLPVVGDGLVEPVRTWRSVAQAAGRALQTSERLDDGRVVREGAVLAVIDQRPCQLELQRLGAQLHEADTQLAQLDTRQRNAEANDRA